jgi:hypothetical protein
MQPKSLRLKVSSGFISVFLLVCSIAILLTGCKPEKMKLPSTAMLTKKQIQKWIDKKYITPGDSTVVIRFRPVYGFPNTVYRLYAAVENKDGSLIEASEIELSQEKGDYNISIDPFTFTGMIEASLKDWNVWKESQGKIELNPDFNHVRLIPFDTTYESLPLFCIKDYVITGENVTEVQHYSKDFTMIITGLLPCPPCINCKVPCPPPTSCNDSCDPIIIKDSLLGGTAAKDSIR